MFMSNVKTLLVFGFMYQPTIPINIPASSNDSKVDVAQNVVE